MTPQLSLCVLSQYLLPFGGRYWAPAETRAQLPSLPAGTHTLTNVTPCGGSRIHRHDHSMLKLEGKRGGAMGHLNLNVLSSMPTQGLEEFRRLVKETRQGKVQ